MTMPNDNCPAAAMPLQTLAAMRVSTVWAHEPIMQPIRPRIDVPSTIHLRPYRSESRPTRRKPIELPMVHMVATQLMFLEGPRSALMRVLQSDTCEALSLRPYQFQSKDIDPVNLAYGQRSKELWAAKVTGRHGIVVATDGLCIDIVDGSIGMDHFGDVAIVGLYFADIILGLEMARSGLLGLCARLPVRGRHGC
ncbi:fungal trichothecene efflux pump [Colletotrichum asianum]